MRKKAFNKKRTSSVPFIIAGIGLSLVIIAGVLLTQQRNKSVETTADVPRISAKDAWSAVEEGKAILVDVRSATSYEQSHASNAINIPIDEIDSRYSELDPSAWIITYCT